MEQQEPKEAPSRFLLAEYTSIRQEILNELQTINQWNLALLPVVGAIYAFTIRVSSVSIPMVGAGRGSASPWPWPPQA